MCEYVCMRVVAMEARRECRSPGGGVKGWKPESIHTLNRSLVRLSSPFVDVALLSRIAVLPLQYAELGALG